MLPHIYEATVVLFASEVRLFDALLAIMPSHVCRLEYKFLRLD